MRVATRLVSGALFVCLPFFLLLFPYPPTYPPPPSKNTGYFSYKWAEVMSADAFAAFEEAGLDKEDKVQEVGRRFRKVRRRVPPPPKHRKPSTHQNINLKTDRAGHGRRYPPF